MDCFMRFYDAFGRTIGCRRILLDSLKEIPGLIQKYRLDTEDRLGTRKAVRVTVDVAL